AASVVGCAKTTTEPTETDQAAKLVDVPGSELKAVQLSDEAAQRIGLETSSVREAPSGGAARSVMPYAAVLYDAAGDTWAYSTSQSGRFMRVSVTIDRIQGDDAFLSSGPAIGTTIVTVGAAELFGAESTFGED
ncbi:MAG: hypothetical protein QOJ19_2195, partial [Acidimicrobiia bacterium]|nr:hypothetical protein [Acidimicrobiia bacterium]